MEKIGATNLNGTTNNDRTNYFENVPTSMLDYALFAESDRMGHLLGVLDQKKLDLQRGVVQNEKRQGENQPYGVTEQLITENTYPVGPSLFLDGDWLDEGPGRGFLERRAGVVQDLLRSEQRHAGDRGRHHAGSRAGESGKVLRRNSRRAAHRQAGSRGLRSAPARIAAGCRTAFRRRVFTGSGTCRNIGSPEEALLDLAAQVLGSGKTSRLYKRLVYKDQIATSATATDDTNEIGGQFDFTHHGQSEARELSQRWKRPRTRNCRIS